MVLAQAKKITISGKVTEANDGKALANVFVQVVGTETYALTHEDGSFKLLGQALGKTTLVFSQLGKKTLQQNYVFVGDTLINIRLEVLSLALKEVAVVAKNRKTGSSSVIDKSAIKHTQPTSLADALQLLPGQLALNPDLSNAQQINLRQVPSNSDAARANALGTAVVLDGIPFANNANLQTNVNILNSPAGALPSFSSVAGRGNDLRQIPADQIESIEVIRGVPSAKYGDLTAGAILVSTRAGVFKPQFTTRFNPNLFEQSVGFGTKLKGKAGILTFDNNVSYSEEDPRNRLSQYTRFTTQLTWSKAWFKKEQFFTTNRLAFFNTLDNNKQDPNDLRYQRKIYSKDQGFRLSSNGKLNTTASWFSAAQYDIGISYSQQKSFVQELITRDLFPVSDATTPITQIGRYGESEYLSTVNTQGKPLSLYGRLEGTIFKKVKQKNSDDNLATQLLVGLEYRHDGNNGSGRQFDPTRPPRQNYSMGDRPRSYADIPALNQLSYYLENRLNGHIFGKEFNLNTGLRFDNIQPENPFKGQFGNILAPRLNFAIETIKNLRLKAGYGITAKAPTLSYLYPGNRYYDLVNYNYYASNPAERLVVISTMVFDTKNENLKSYQAKKMELGFDYDHHGFLGYITGFREITTGAFGTDRNIQLINVAKYEASSFPSGQPPVLNPVPVRYDPFFAAFDVSNNNRRIVNTGMEFQFDTPPIDLISTSFSFNGAYIKTLSYDDGNVVDADLAVFTSITPSRVPIFRSGFGNEGKRFNTSLRFITRIPKLRFLISGLVQTIWVNSNQNINLSPFPVGYVDNTGKVVELNEQEAQLDQYKDLRRALSSTLQNVDQPPPLWLFNLRITKEFKNNNSLSFYINNVLSDRGQYFNSRTQAYVNRNQNLFFGAEFTINF